MCRGFGLLKPPAGHGPRSSGLDFAPGMRSQRAHISAMQVRSVWPSFCSKYLHTRELRRRQERCHDTPSVCALIRSRYLTPSSWSVDISETNSREALPRPPLPSAPLPYLLLPAADCFSPPPPWRIHHFWLPISGILIGAIRGMVFEVLFPFGNVHAARKETFQERYSKVWLLDAHSQRLHAASTK